MTTTSSSQTPINSASPMAELRAVLSAQQLLDCVEAALLAAGFAMVGDDQSVGRFVERIEDVPLVSGETTALPQAVYDRARDLKSALNGVELVLLFAGVQLHATVLVGSGMVAVLSMSILAGLDSVHCATLVQLSSADPCNETRGAP